MTQKRSKPGNPSDRDLICDCFARHYGTHYTQCIEVSCDYSHTERFWDVHIKTFPQDLLKFRGRKVFRDRISRGSFISKVFRDPYGSTIKTNIR